MVSIIVPVYNVENYLSACIDSILAQTNPDFELLLVDDGSTDSSGDICDKYAELDNRIKVFHKKNGGVSSARNLALDHMSGKYCILVDSDDTIHPCLLEKTVEIIEKEKSDAVVYDYKEVEESFEIEECYKIENFVSIESLSRDEVFKIILEGKRFRMLACNKLYRVPLWENIRYPEGRKFGDDTSVTYRLMAQCNKVNYIKQELYYYRMRNDSALHNKIDFQNLQLFESYAEMLDFFSKKFPKWMNLAAYAYVIRIFDFCANMQKCALEKTKQMQLLSLLRRISLPYKKVIMSTNMITIKQRILLGVLMKSEKIFLLIYR